VIISLAEANWVGLPADTSEEVKHCMMGPGSTLEEELAFNVCRKNMTNSGTGKLGRKSIWHRCLTSGILADSDFRQVCPCAEDRLMASMSVKGTILASIFDSRATDFSLDTKLLDDIAHRAKAGETLSPSPEKYMLRASAFSALKKCGRNYEELKRSWLAELLPEGCVMVKRSQRETTWVVGCSDMASPAQTL
jgi:hypothetical protein